jgi:hypothetical protein
MVKLNTSFMFEKSVSVFFNSLNSLNTGSVFKFKHKLHVSFFRLLECGERCWTVKKNYQNIKNFKGGSWNTPRKTNFSHYIRRQKFTIGYLVDIFYVIFRKPKSRDLCFQIFFIPLNDFWISIPLPIFQATNNPIYLNQSIWLMK